MHYIIYIDIYIDYLYIIIIDYLYYLYRYLYRYYNIF